jgi:pimeloyl-ACP methyl ester carboxylesterase
MPGYGHSNLIEPLSYRAIADRLISLLDRLEIAQADLVGLSFGGMHALHTAIRHPERVKRMVLADTSPAFGMDGTSSEDWIASRLEPIDGGKTPGDIAENVIDAITANPLTGRIREEIIASFGEIPVEGFRAAVTCLPTNDVRSHLAEIHHPTCVIVGELDRETPVSYARVLADGLPNAECHVLDGVGHLTPCEAPDRFNELVSQFLTSTTSPSNH